MIWMDLTLHILSRLKHNSHHQQPTPCLVQGEAFPNTLPIGYGGKLSGLSNHRFSIESYSLQPLLSTPEAKEMPCLRKWGATDTAGNTQAYIDFSMARLIINQLSTRNKLLISSYMVLRDRARKPGIPFFRKEVSNIAPWLSDSGHSYRCRHIMKVCMLWGWALAILSRFRPLL